MKITEVIKKYRAKAEFTRQLVAGRPKDRYVRGAGIAYDRSANILEETVREIQTELNRVKVDAKNGELSRPIRANIEAMAMMLEWVLGEEE